jgi:hypothetical protein
VIFVDSNIPMYVVGKAHPHKTDAQRLLERAILARDRLVTDAEVLQEILHRYTALDRRDMIQPAFDALLGLVDEVFPVTSDDLLHARTLVLGATRLSARDAVHAATMARNGVHRILTFDGDFDVIPGIERIFR